MYNIIILKSCRTISLLVETSNIAQGVLWRGNKTIFKKVESPFTNLFEYYFNICTGALLDDNSFSNNDTMPSQLRKL